MYVLVPKRVNNLEKTSAQTCHKLVTKRVLFWGNMPKRVVAISLLQNYDEFIDMYS